MHRLSFMKCQFIQDADFLHSGLSLYYLGSVHTWYRGTPLQYGNYLAPKFSSAQVPVKDLILKHKIWHWVSLCTLILLLLGQSTAVYSLLSSCSTMGSDSAKWSNYVHRVLFHVLKVWTQHLCVLVPIGGHWFLGTKCGQPLTHLNSTQVDIYKFYAIIVL